MKNMNKEIRYRALSPQNNERFANFQVFIMVALLLCTVVTQAHSQQMPAIDPTVNSISRTLSYNSSTKQWFTVEQWDKFYGLNCAVPEAEARNFLDAEKPLDALKVLETVTPRCKINSQYGMLKAEAEMGVGNYAAAVQHYRISIDADHARQVGEYGSDSAISQSLGEPRNWFRYVEALYRTGQTDYAVNVYNMVAANENQPTGYVGSNILPNALPLIGTGPNDVHPSVEFFSAMRHVIEGRNEQVPDKQYAHYRQAFALMPSLPVTQYLMGRAEAETKTFADGKPYFQQAVALARASSDPNGSALADAIQAYSDNIDPEVLMARWKTINASGALDQTTQNSGQ